MNTIQDRLNKELSNINKAGLFKQERIIQSQQNAEITVNNTSVLNFCANNYLGLSSNADVISAAKNNT